MNVLVVNCGSSSLKYQLIDSDSEAVLAKGLCERIGIDGRLVYTCITLAADIDGHRCRTWRREVCFFYRFDTGSIKNN